MVMLVSTVFPHFPAAMQLRGRGKSVVGGGGTVLTEQLLPTDAQGTMTLTLQNVIGGSAWRIELQSDGSLVDSGVAAGTGATNLPITLSYYGTGSAYNDIRVKVRKASAAPKYQPFETQTTLSASPRSVFIAQVADPIA